MSDLYQSADKMLFLAHQQQKKNRAELVTASQYAIPSAANVEQVLEPKKDQPPAEPKKKR